MSEHTARYGAVLTERDLARLSEIQRLLDEAYDHYFKYGDGHCKSSEGYVEVRFPNYFERRNGDRSVGVGIYSYVLGPSRMHDFDTIGHALDTVRRWHQEEMSTVYGANEDGWPTSRNDSEESPDAPTA